MIRVNVNALLVVETKFIWMEKRPNGVTTLSK